MVRFKEAEKKSQQSQTRRRLMDAAAAAFAKEGYDGANINRISQRAGYAKGTVYNYFESKRQLMLELIEEVAAQHFEFISGEVLQASDPKERMKTFYRTGFRFVEQFYDRARVIAITIFGVDTEFKSHIYQAYLPLFDFVSREILQPGVENGIFRQVDLFNTSTLVMTLYLGTGTQTDPQGRVFMDPDIASIFVLNALRPDREGI